MRVTVEPGVCGFPCHVRAKKTGRYTVSVKLAGSECKHIKRLGEQFKEISLRELFAPVTKSPVFLFAQKAGCHPSCPVPMAVLKAVEVAMDMALPRDVTIKFASRETKGEYGSKPRSK